MKKNKIVKNVKNVKVQKENKSLVFVNDQLIL